MCAIFAICRDDAPCGILVRSVGETSPDRPFLCIFGSESTWSTKSINNPLVMSLISSCLLPRKRAKALSAPLYAWRVAGDLVRAYCSPKAKKSRRKVSPSMAVRMCCTIRSTSQASRVNGERSTRVDLILSIRRFPFCKMSADFILPERVRSSAWQTMDVCSRRERPFWVIRM